MFQNYTADVVKKPSQFPSGGVLKTKAELPIGINSSQVFITGGVNGVANQVQFDTTNDNVIMSFDGSLVAPDGNDFLAFVYTYASSSPVSGSITIPTTRVSIVPFFNIQGCGYFQGNVVVPRLQLSEGEQQYVMVGVASYTDKSSNVAMYIDMKLHLNDQQVFQPSK